MSDRDYEQEIVAAAGEIAVANPMKLDEQRAAFRRWFRAQPEEEREALTDAVLNVVFDKIRGEIVQTEITDDD